MYSPKKNYLGSRRQTVLNEVNQNGKSPSDNHLTTKKKGNVIVNPKKEDLMSELYTKNLKNALSQLRTEAASTTVPATTTDGTKDPKGKAKAKNTGDVKPETPTCEEIDDSAAKREIQERMRQRLLQLTQEHDSKYLTK